MDLGGHSKNWATMGGGHAKNSHVPKGGSHPKINEHLGNFAATIDVQQTCTPFLSPPPQIFQNIIYTVTHNAQLYSIAVV